MKIRVRLILLLGCLLAVLAAATAIMGESHRREAGAIRRDLAQQRAVLLDRLLALTSQSLRGYASDYSLWDEMLGFVQTGDPAWAKINLEASFPNFGVQAAWVLRVDGSQVYRGGELAPVFAAEKTFADPAFLERLRQERQQHFYLESPAGLLEVCTAPIQPSNDVARTSDPRGWLIVGRLWNGDHMVTLADALQSKLAFAPEPSVGPSAVSLERPLLDWNGQKVRTLHVNYDSLALARLLEGNEDEFFVLFFLGTGMIVVTAFGLSRWVLNPLHQLGESLETGRADALQPLHHQQSEFGHLARLVEQSFEQRAALEREIRERTRLAETLQETGTQLRESVELRNRLARDLHDGVIQSIYSAGIGLEGVRSLLHTDSAGADQRLAASQAALNSTIREVRTFINGLEAEAAPVRPFRQTLATLVATMQSVQPGNIRLEVNESVARRISPTQELQLLHILRESISNALRHAGNAMITLGLSAAPDGQAELIIADDGCGFDPSAPQNPGRGLVNLGIRAREIGGRLEINTSPGKGTRIVLTFQPTYPP